MHLVDNGALEVEVETSEAAALAALAAAQEVFDDAGVIPAAAYRAWAERGDGGGAPDRAALWVEAQQAAAEASGGEARIALAGAAAAFAEALTAEAQRTEQDPYHIELPLGGFEPEGPEFP